MCQVKTNDLTAKTVESVLEILEAKDMSSRTASLV